MTARLTETGPSKATHSLIKFFSVLALGMLPQLHPPHGHYSMLNGRNGNGECL